MCGYRDPARFCAVLRLGLGSVCYVEGLAHLARTPAAWEEVPVVVAMEGDVQNAGVAVEHFLGSVAMVNILENAHGRGWRSATLPFQSETIGHLRVRHTYILTHYSDSCSGLLQNSLVVFVKIKKTEYWKWV